MAKRTPPARDKKTGRFKSRKRSAKRNPVVVEGRGVKTVKRRQIPADAKGKGVDLSELLAELLVEVEAMIAAVKRLKPAYPLKANLAALEGTHGAFVHYLQAGLKKGERPEVLRVNPYPNEHSCRIREPSAFQKGSFRRMPRNHEGRPYSVIIGRLRGKKTTTEQAYRYPVEYWTEAQARAHCKKRIHEPGAHRFTPARKANPGRFGKHKEWFPHGRFVLHPRGEPIRRLEKLVDGNSFSSIVEALGLIAAEKESATRKENPELSEMFGEISGELLTWSFLLPDIEFK